MNDTYSIEIHRHRYAAWAAARAAQRGMKGMKSQLCRDVLEAVGLDSSFANVNQLPEAGLMNEVHRAWRGKAVSTFAENGVELTHGRVAKLINIYLKTKFVCAGHHANERVRRLHPPIDGFLLQSLASDKMDAKQWKWLELNKTGWTKFTSFQYEEVIALVEESMGDRALWEIERHWDIGTK